MALKHFGKAENDPGEWVDFGIAKPFRLRIRRIPPNVSDDIDKRYRAKETFEVRDGIRRRVPDQDAVIEGLRDKALFAWTDAEGLEVDVGDAEAAKMWGDLLKRTVEIGEKLALGGSTLTRAAKEVVLDVLRPIADVEQRDDKTGETRVVQRDVASFIFLEAVRIQTEFGKRAADQQSNS